MYMEVVLVWLQQRTAESSRIETFPYATPTAATENSPMPHFCAVINCRGGQDPFNGFVPDVLNRNRVGRNQPQMKIGTWWLVASSQVGFCGFQDGLPLKEGMALNHTSSI